MKVLVTGNQGYIGSVLTQLLHERGHEVHGFDVGYYVDCSLFDFNPKVSKQHQGDIRTINSKVFQGVDAVIHLAALSNDPLGEFNPSLTDDINLEGTLRSAKLAREAGVKRFVYASSQSMYGISKTDHELDEDNSEKHPITAYARTKWEAELELKKMHSDNFIVSCFRPSTVFGLSPRLRCDIVFNYFVSCAFTTGKIEVKSDGTPWRPIVHVRDVSQAFIAGIEAPASVVGGQSFNVGVPNGNYSVRDLAEAAQRSVPGSDLVFTGEHGTDSRTYRVSFHKILTRLAPWFTPDWSLDRGGAELVSKFREIQFKEQDFRGEQCVRLAKLKSLLQAGTINQNLELI